MEPNQRPILLCHVACSGGSVIFRKLCENFGFWGISEVSHFYRPKKNKAPFSPFDPEILMFQNGWLDAKEMESAFASRIQNCLNLSQSKGHRLLIRDHTHSAFFQQDGILLSEGYSWFQNQCDELFGGPCPTIVTLRDPVDSWLGMKHSFPKTNFYSFDEYCQRYLRFYRAVDESVKSNAPIEIFKFEDLISNADSVLAKVGATLKMERNHSDCVTVASTGNSGRQSQTLGTRVRRPYSSEFLKSASQSTSYAELASLLEYEHCCNELSFGIKLSAQLNSFRKRLLKGVFDLGRAGSKMVKDASVPD